MKHLDPWTLSYETFTRKKQPSSSGGNKLALKCDWKDRASSDDACEEIHLLLRTPSLFLLTLGQQQVPAISTARACWEIQNKWWKKELLSFRYDLLGAAAAAKLSLFHRSRRLERFRQHLEDSAIVGHNVEHTQFQRDFSTSSLDSSWTVVGLVQHLQPGQLH